MHFIELAELGLKLFFNVNKHYIIYFKESNDNEGQFINMTLIFSYLAYLKPQEVYFQKKIKSNKRFIYFFYHTLQMRLHKDA